MRDEEGKETGVFLDNAMKFVSKSDVNSIISLCNLFPRTKDPKLLKRIKY